MVSYKNKSGPDEVPRDRPAIASTLDGIHKLTGKISWSTKAESPRLKADDPLLKLGEVLGLWVYLLGTKDVQTGFETDLDGYWLRGDSLDFLDSVVNEVDDLLSGGGDTTKFDPLTLELLEELRQVLDRAKYYDWSRVPIAGSRSPELFLETIMTRVLREISLRSVARLERRAEMAVTRTEAAASAASAAAGTTGEAALSAHYDSLAREEKNAANVFRWLTTFLALTAGGTALGFVLGAGSGISWLDIQSGDYVHLLQRALLIGGVLGLAGYFARQAHQHRSMANWAGSLAVQLRTFESYLSPINDEDVKNELRKSFGSRVFGDHPSIRSESSVTPTADLGEKAMDLASRVINK